MHSYGKPYDDGMSYDLSFIDWMLEGRRGQILLIGLSQNDLGNDAAIRRIRRNTSKWGKNDKFLTTIINSKCQKTFIWKSQKGRWKYKSASKGCRRSFELFPH